MLPTIELVCPNCRARLSFAAAQAGASGPCYQCGHTIVVPIAAPAPPVAARPMSNPELTVPPSPVHQKTADALAKEAQKHGIQMLGTRVIQIAEKVRMGENVGAALWGGKIRVDHAQAVRMRSPRGDFFVFIPWSGNMKLAHELASVIPGGLPSCLYLSRGLMGAWSGGRYEGSNGGEKDPIAVAAEPEYKLHDGIQWDWESGRTRIKLHWGMQVVPFDVTPEGPRSLHVMHTAEIGILFRDHGLPWYLERQQAFQAFVQKRAYAGPPPQRLWRPPPIAALFLDDFYR